MEPWFDPNMCGSIAGSALGCVGGTLGALSGILAPRGKAKTLVYSLFVVCTVACLLLLITAGVALILGQPYGIWYGLGLPGLIGLIVFPSVFPRVRRAYAAAEMRKSLAADM